jgi:hypothetical protein
MRGILGTVRMTLGEFRTVLRPCGVALILEWGDEVGKVLLSAAGPAR